MAEMVVDQTEQPDVETPDDDVLPDDVEEVKSLPIFELLEGGNLVDRLDKSDWAISETLKLLSDAEESMSEWKQKYKKALDLAKLVAESNRKTFPFEDASQVMLPFLFEAMLDFHARTVPELVWASQVVGVAAYGFTSEAKEDRAERVGKYLNWQITEEIPFWRREQDKLLLHLPCVGTAYKKTVRDFEEQKNRSDLYLADEIIFDQAYRTFEEAPDKFIKEQYSRNELIGFIRSEQKWKIAEDELPRADEHPEDYEIIHAWTWVDLDGDGLEELYEIIIWAEQDRAVACFPAFDEEGVTANEDGEIIKVEPLAIFTQYRFLPDPEGGPMGMGWGIMLSDTFDALNTTVRQLIDAGTLSNLAGNSGLIDAQMAGGSGRGNRQQSGPIEVRMGELTPITTGGKPLGQSVVQFPYSGPNTTLYQLTEWLLEQVRGMTNSALSIETNSQEAAIMYLARLQQGLKVPNSIVMRVYDCAKDEFGKLAALNFKHYSDRKYNDLLDGEKPFSMRADFNPGDLDIAPAIDPSQGSDIERQTRANIVLEEAKTQTTPVISVRQAYDDWLHAINAPNIDRLLPEPDPGPDPMEELMMANMGRRAEIEEREIALKEAQFELDQIEAMAKAAQKAADLGITLDKSEADITLQYANAFAKLVEAGMQIKNANEAIGVVKRIESQLLDNRPARQVDSGATT